MPRWDLTLEELESYTPAIIEPAGFDRFWTQTLEEAREHEFVASFTPVASLLTAIATLDVTFTG